MHAGVAKNRGLSLLTPGEVDGHGTAMHPLETRIRDKLIEALAPLSLTIEDESRLHAGHNPAAGAGGTHYRVAIVSAAFAGLGRVARQRRVYDLLADEIRDGVHALSLVTLAPGEPAR